MPFLYEKLDTLREIGSLKEFPEYIKHNLNPNFELRPYQISAFENYITAFETHALKKNQVLFHMATGSGKTLIMAGLMLYLYQQGYRNFLFFVNLDNIVQKTKVNFLDTTSSKYLFANEINILGERIPLKEVSNFDGVDPTAINICFTTTQGLHSDMWAVKENRLSFESFADKKVVLISDEAHHLNADTKKGKLSAEEEQNSKSWEYTVNRIFASNNENLLLEFTATCDITNPLIKASYESKIIFNYPLSDFRADLYSKEIKTMRSDLSVNERSIQALILSQYRYKVFQHHRLNIKPVIFFQSRLIKENAANMQAVLEMVRQLTGATIKELFEKAQSPTIQEAHRFFINNEITYEQIAQELKDDFDENHCISANDNIELEKKQIILNSLEDNDNPYRAVFAVDKLNEGWDVLNLFDIVRLYETRDGKDGKPGKTTMKEAQLIGRGARYCPFKLNEEQEKYKRKFDNDLDNPLRICEELFYHCWNEPRYISELKSALREIGIDLDKVVTKEYTLKPDFKEDSLYQSGLVFKNERIKVEREHTEGLLSSVRSMVYSISLHAGKSGEDIMFEETSTDVKGLKVFTKTLTIGQIASINYAIVNKALRKFDVYKFSTLKIYYPNLTSTRQFVFDENYLAAIKVQIISPDEEPSVKYWFKACVYALRKIAEAIANTPDVYIGSTTFTAISLHEIIKDKRVNYSEPIPGSSGYSQNDLSVGDDRLDLSQEDWFAFNDNFGTSEEKAFVAYFKNHVVSLKTKYNKVYLVRNERQLAVYSFKNGERFEPDYLLFLHKNNADGIEQLQIFVEPKGDGFLVGDAWKEDFLLELEEKAVPVVRFADDNLYKIWGFHFFNRSARSAEFVNDMDRL